MTPGEPQGDIAGKSEHAEEVSATDLQDRVAPAQISNKSQAPVETITILSSEDEFGGTKVDVAALVQAEQEITASQDAKAAAMECDKKGSQPSSSKDPNVPSKRQAGQDKTEDSTQVSKKTKTEDLEG